MMDGLPNTESMMTTLKGGGEEEACRWGWASGVCRAGGSAYCTSSSSKFSSAAYFRGRPRCMWRPRLNSSSSTVQKDPNSSSTLTKHLCRERLVRMAPWESKPAGGGGAGAARCRCSDRRDRDRGRTHTETQGGGQRVRTKMKEKKKSHCELWSITKSMEGRQTPKQAGTLDVMAHRQRDEAATASFHQWTETQGSKGRTYPLIFWGRLFWNSISSTVHTAPFTFSTRTKHLWRLRLCRTAFCSWCKNRERQKRLLSVQ